MQAPCVQRWLHCAIPSRKSSPVPRKSIFTKSLHPALEPQSETKKGVLSCSCKSDRRNRMKTIIFGIGLMVATATATPVFAQAYCACWGTGNVSNEPLLEKSNGAYGYEMSAAPQRGTTTSAKRITGNSAYAYSPVPNANRHMKHKQRQ